MMKQKEVNTMTLDELQDKLKDCSTRVLKSDCLDLPEKLYTKRSVAMTPEQLKAYVEMKKSAITFFENNPMTAASVLTQMIRLHQITCGHVKTDDGEVKAIKNNRIKELLQVLQETDGKVIIWAVYRHDIQTIEKEIADEYGKETVASYYGILKILYGSLLLTILWIVTVTLDFLSETQRQGVMALLLLLVTLLCIILMTTV